jgi:light-regulated signal transduction histidine kinase (bacteriophytochrome)
MPTPIQSGHRKLSKYVAVTDTDTIEQPHVALVHRLEVRNERLQAALQAASREIDALTYSIAHDLRTPLMHIDGFAALLQTSRGAVLDHESRDYLARIIAATRTMNAQIAALVEYSRVNSAELVMSEVDLEDVSSEALELIRPWTNGRNIQWQRTRLPTVRGDENLLRQVFVSLITNAVKYTRPRAPASIEIGTRVERPGEVILFVRDNGVGFDLKCAGKLFTPFQRMHPADAFPGVGMGLAKARRIVARHGGRLWAESQVGQGATFSFTLPEDVDT